MHEQLLSLELKPRGRKIALQGWARTAICYPSLRFLTIVSYLRWRPVFRSLDGSERAVVIELSRWFHLRRWIAIESGGSIGAGPNAAVRIPIGPVFVTRRGSNAAVAALTGGVRTRGVRLAGRAAIALAVVLASCSGSRLTRLRSKRRP